MIKDSFWIKKNVLITGISGFLAPHIAEKIEALGANVIGTIHDYKKVSYGQITGLFDKVNIAQVDINDLQRMKNLISNYEVDIYFIVQQIQ